MPRTGSALLPLHGGSIPPWLAQRMARLGRVITETIVHEYGRVEFVRRLSHPFWFQSFGAVMGMDWHSSGMTIAVVRALSRGLAPIADEIGLWVCGGKGRASRDTPGQLVAVGDKTGLDGHALAHASRLTAKVDSAAVQDGFELYLHAFIVERGGSWTVAQQGMNATRGQARRYHWLSEGLTSFVDAPHAGIEGPARRELIVNLTDVQATEARRAQVELVREGPDRVLGELAKLRGHSVNLVLPGHHEVRPEDVSLRRLGGALAAAAERGPVDFADLLSTPGVGARTVFALAQVAEVIHGAPYRFSDPARFAFAHGGKDGHPFPVPTKVYDETIRVLRDGLERAKLGEDDRLAAIRRLDAQARTLEQTITAVDFDGFVGDERGRSRSYGGRTVFDGGRSDQLELW